MSDIIERIITRGDISALSASDKTKYYTDMCARLGLDPLTQPFQFLTLSGRQVMYATKSATEQLRVIHGISVTALDHSNVGGVYVVTCKVANNKGRVDCATGAVAIEGLKGDSLANAVMKAETKAKRRATLSIAGLGMLDESEVETIPGAIVQTVEQKRAEFDRAEPHNLGAEWGRLGAPVEYKKNKGNTPAASRVEHPKAALPAAREPVAAGKSARARITRHEIKHGLAKSTGRPWTQYLIDLIDEDTALSYAAFTWSETVYWGAVSAYDAGTSCEYELKLAKSQRAELAFLVPLASGFSSTSNALKLPGDIPF